MRARCEGDTASWVAGAPVALGTHGRQELGQQKIWCSRIPWMEEPGRLQSIGSLRVGHD